MKRLDHPRERGFSLIVCLIILTLLSILVVSFITTTTSERTTSRAYLNKASAEFAANTGVNQAISLLTEQIVQYPDSATVWDSITPPVGPKPADNVPVEGTYLYASPSGPNFATGAGVATPKPALVLPLFSRSKEGVAMTEPVEITVKNTVLGSEVWNDTTSVNLNRARDEKDSGGWIGSPPSALPTPSPGAKATPTPTPKPFRAKWIEITDKPVQTSGTPVPGAATPRVIGRYAYWIEDESFKVNLNLLQSDTLGRGSELDPLTGEWARDAKALAQQFYKDHPERASDFPAWHTPIQGLVRSASAINDSAVLDKIASATTTLRNDFFGKQLFEFRAFNRADPSLYLLADKTKFFATIFAGGLNLSRLGTQRVNLNALVGLDDATVVRDPEKTGYKWDAPPYPLVQNNSGDKLGKNDTELTEEKQVRQIVRTIRYHAPKFGQRFYRNTSPDTASTAAAAAPLRNAENVSEYHQNIYLHKVAANIRDYIDPDSQPTIIMDPNPEDTATMNKWGVAAQNTQDAQGTTPSRRVAPQFAMMPPTVDGDNPYWAQGKEAAPFLQEAVVRWRTKCDPVTKRYSLRVDYYVEFWNMTDQPIYAAKQTIPGRLHLNDAFVKIADPLGWKAHGGTQPALKADNSPAGNPGPNDIKDVVINLFNRSGQQDVFSVSQDAGAVSNRPPEGKFQRDGVIFQPGCTVITTDPDVLPGPPSPGTNPASVNPEAISTGGVNKKATYYIDVLGQGKRIYEGPIPAGCDGIWAQFRDTLSGGQYLSDYGTEVILGNADGYLDSQPFCVAVNNDFTGPYITHLDSGKGKTTRDDTYGGTLMGNTNSPSQMGDPRSNNEQLYFTRYRPGSVNEPDVTRYFNPDDDLYRFSLGWPNSRYVWPYGGGSGGGAYLWKDYYKVWSKTAKNTPNEGQPNPTADTAAAYVANKRLRSIGQLGDVYDPARVVSIKGGIRLLGARGGGRTFKVGQNDDLVDMESANAASQQWASYRLTDMFSTTSDMVLPGLININGVMRDNGAALRAACYGMTLKTVYQDFNTSNPTVTQAKNLDSTEAGTAGVQQLVNQAITRLKETNPNRPSYFRERGELSQLDLFSTSTKLVVGVDMKIAFDRTREELMRRLIDMTTTRGNVFSVYTVGQSINQGRDGVKRVTGEHWVKTTFALLPRDAAGNPFEPGVKTVSGAKVPVENFNPLDESQVNKRFAKPDHYDVQLLQVTPL